MRCGVGSRAWAAVDLQNGVSFLPKTDDHARRLKMLQNDAAEMGGEEVIEESVDVDRPQEEMVVARGRAVGLSHYRRRVRPFRPAALVDYYWVVPRSPFVRLLAVVLFVLAGSAEPAWELAHALSHLHGQHQQESRGVPPLRADRSSLSALGQDHGHRHPAFEPAARASGTSAAPGPVLPSAMFCFSAAVSPIRVPPRPASNTRAGPDPTYSPQSRAPPFL